MRITLLAASCLACTAGELRTRTRGRSSGQGWGCLKGSGGGCDMMTHGVAWVSGLSFSLIQSWSRCIGTGLDSLGPAV